MGKKLLIEPLLPISPPANHSPQSSPGKLILTEKSERGLAFDVENKPGTYGPGDYTHPKVTAIGAQWLDADDGIAWCLDRRDPGATVSALEEFRAIWDEADFVLGHNIRRHDRKLLDGLYTAYGIPLLATKRMVDTYLDQPRMRGFSRSLENLAARWGCPVQKLHLSEHEWEQAYDGIPEGVALMRKRVLSDVQISIWIYHECIRRGLLRW